MNQDTWASVDAYFSEKLIRPDDGLEAALRASDAAGLPAINISPTHGKLLNVLARTMGARRILEVGTLGGYSTIWLARALPPDGRLITLELDDHHAAVARANLRAAGVADHVEVRVGRAVELLAALVSEKQPPFDMVFIDADKPSNLDYLTWALALTRPGSLIVVDNVVRNGEVVSATSADASVRGVRRMMDAIAHDPAIRDRVDATAIQTVGIKGYDGMALLRVT
ncbi:MAG TPA: O-methyltransferase [Thermoflexales bacterium]|nr:O-methyltransferase [Thermoflexales bacterium]